jgi:hypothetical protein
MLAPDRDSEEAESLTTPETMNWCWLKAGKEKEKVVTKQNRT